VERSQARAKQGGAKVSIKPLLGVVLAVISAVSESAEQLGHISDETQPIAKSAPPADNPQRQIIYRVICSPEDELLPDCEQPLVDVHPGQQPAVVTSPDFPAEAEVAETGVEPVAKSGAHHASRKTAKSASKKKSTKSATATQSKTRNKKPASRIRKARP